MSHSIVRDTELVSLQAALTAETERYLDAAKSTQRALVAVTKKGVIRLEDWQTVCKHLESEQAVQHRILLVHRELLKVLRSMATSGFNV